MEVTEVFVDTTAFTDGENGRDRMRRVRGGKMSGGGRGSVRDGIGMVGFKVGYVESRMDAHGEGKGEAVGMGGDFGFNGKGAEADVIKFGRGARGGKVATEEPDELTGCKGGERGTAGVVVTCLGILSVTKDGG